MELSDGDDEGEEGVEVIEDSDNDDGMIKNWYFLKNMSNESRLTLFSRGVVKGGQGGPEPPGIWQIRYSNQEDRADCAHHSTANPTGFKKLYPFLLKKYPS